ncbi:tetratricopeptide repeat protein [Psychroserpens ponticola]|uniref:Tetratricopeptide repeat protein n=1 Tax=Psychroserpens ponticola TaxID=2932268 RepID=A0ABY7S131_9FLAO|nr:hypothetical protein [Psychroserpens ponticola]WCO02848.1 hypothetical protein MUN68_004995 [Psychroserpens ponticola]
MKKIIIPINLLFSSLMFAHGDLHDRIQNTTIEIKKYPDSAYLYFKRGKLYFQHESYDKSLIDLKKSNDLGYFSTEQKLILAKNYFRLKDYNQSLLLVETILSNKPQHVQAIKLKARNYFEQQLFLESAKAYQDVIAFSKQTFPENYIEASIAWEALNNQSGDVNALNSIKRGIEELGNIISLYNRLIELAINKNDYNRAIKAQMEVLEFSTRKELAYYKLSELFNFNKEYTKALEHVKLARIHFNKLPARIQNTPSMKELNNNIEIKKKSLITKSRK